MAALARLDVEAGPNRTGLFARAPHPRKRQNRCGVDNFRLIAYDDSCERKSLFLSSYHFLFIDSQEKLFTPL